MATWRLIEHFPQTGAQNMAIDQAIMEAVGRERVPPTLRVYAWEPACLSLGYNQSSNDVDRAALNQRGWQVVRRATGGKAILHVDELTYSVTLPKNAALVSGGIVESYQRLSGALMRAVEQLGAAVQSLPAEKSSADAGPVCFEVPSNYEVTAAGKKLIGSAQVRRYDAVLQHGTLPLYGDITRICDALVFASDAARQVARQRVADRATTLQSALGQRIEWQTVADVIAEAFATEFDLHLEPASLGPEEAARAAELAHETYSSAAWTHRRQ